jgi:hypothetical protein
MVQIPFQHQIIDLKVSLGRAIDSNNAPQTSSRDAFCTILQSSPNPKSLWWNYGIDSRLDANAQLTLSPTVIQDWIMTTNGNITFSSPKTNRKLRTQIHRSSTITSGICDQGTPVGKVDKSTLEPRSNKNRRQPTLGRILVNKIVHTKGTVAEGGLSFVVPADIRRTAPPFAGLEQ